MAHKVAVDVVAYYLELKLSLDVEVVVWVVESSSELDHVGLLDDVGGTLVCWAVHVQDFWNRVVEVCDRLLFPSNQVLNKSASNSVDVVEIEHTEIGQSLAVLWTFLNFASVSGLTVELQHDV